MKLIGVPVLIPSSLKAALGFEKLEPYRISYTRTAPLILSQNLFTLKLKWYVGKCDCFLIFFVY